MNKNKEKILGMKFGTACARLRKHLLFKFVKQLKLDTCYKCNLLISNVDDLSIEHKIPWESSQKKDLFWNLDNIAFSHLRCNTSDVKARITRRKQKK